MIAPALMGIASAVGAWEGAYKESVWAAAMGWGGFMFYFIGVWFHEFFVSGPNTYDHIFGNYLATSKFAFGVLGILTVFATRKTGSTKMPFTWLANAVATVGGLYLVNRLDNRYHADDELEGEAPLPEEASEVAEGARL